MGILIKHLSIVYLNRFMPCVCTLGIPGKTLNYTWYYGNDKYSWLGPEKYCNPYNCSNKACTAKGCANARIGYCRRYGQRECNGVRICEGEKCVGTTPTRYGTCAETLWEQNITGKPFCEDVRRGTVPPPGTKPSQIMCAGGTKEQICAKSCQFMDLGCLSAKIQCNCGGGPALGADINCFGTGIPCGYLAIGAALVVLFIALK